MIAKNLGYEFKLISGYEYEAEDIFSDYVNTLYSVKCNTKGPLRFIAKMLLNTLYGIFGRQLETSEVIIIPSDEEDEYLLTRYVTSAIPLDNNKTALIILPNRIPDSVAQLGITIETNVKQKFQLVKSNIAIASAVTAYARIHMMDFKLNEACYYTDTDSIFVDNLEPFKQFIGNELGQFKDELHGLVVEEAEFIAIKQLGYWFYDEKGDRVEKSVFAGVARDSLSFDQIKKLQNGETITVKSPDRFFKSILTLNIQMFNYDINIVKTNAKQLINNKYLPLNIF